MLGAGNQRNGYRIQHVFKSVDLRQTEIEDAKSPAHFFSLVQRFNAAPVPAHPAASTALPTSSLRTVSLGTRAHENRWWLVAQIDASQVDMLACFRKTAPFIFFQNVRKVRTTSPLQLQSPQKTASIQPIL